MKRGCIILKTILCIQSVFGQRIRKEWSEFTANERAVYVNALAVLDDAFVTEMWTEHMGRSSDGFHTNMGPKRATSVQNVREGGFNFLPWHRLFLLEMENRMRYATQDYFLTLPYWNWYNVWDENSALFGDLNHNGLLGYSNSNFTNWSYNRVWNSTVPQPTNNYSTQTDVENFGWNLEFGGHTGGHIFVGGTMGSMESPADPVFYLHHTMVDREWDTWHNNQSNVIDYSIFSDDMETFSEYFNGGGWDVNAQDFVNSKYLSDGGVWYASNHLLEVSNWQTSFSIFNVNLYRTYLFYYSTGSIVSQNTKIKQSDECTFVVTSAYDIVLKDGFHAEQGSEFHAKVQ